MGARSSFADVLKYLRQRGFERAASSPSLRAFEGPLHLRAGEVQVRLEIADWEFVTYPRLTMLTRPTFIPTRMSNIDSTGGLCYLAPDSVVLDRFDPAGSIALCLQAAEELLNGFTDDPTHKNRAVQDEFHAYWSGGGKRAWALIGDVPAEATNAEVRYIETDEQRASLSLPMISSSSQEVEQVAQAFGGKVQGQREGRCWLLQTSVYPIAPADGLPTTLRGLFGYLKNWDPLLSRQIQQILSSDRDYLKSRLVTFAVRSPAGWVGFSFSIASFLGLTGHRRLPNVCLQHLHRHGESIEITRLALTEIGARFIHSRNLTHASLLGKRVTIVGCGAIGGYVAQAVARLGAGAGGGRLRLIDPAILEPGNLGREQEVLERLVPFRQHHSHAAEAGGILIGYRRGRHLHVVDATTPGARDSRSRYEFQRTDPVHQYTALERWKRSRHTLDYLGEWHTHPQVHPTPSSVDAGEWAKIMCDRRVPMLFAVMGIESWWIGVGRDGQVVPAFRAKD